MINLSKVDIEASINEQYVTSQHPSPQIINHAYLTYANQIPAEVQKRYEFSSYIIDPNKHHWSFIVKILNLVLKYIANTRAKIRANLTK